MALNSLPTQVNQFKVRYNFQEETIFCLQEEERSKLEQYESSQFTIYSMEKLRNIGKNKWKHFIGGTIKQKHDKEKSDFFKGC